jgi:dienelactone hydrolase
MDFSKITISGEIKDLEATIEYITNFKYKKIIILGASFGGGVTGLIDYSKYKNVIALILWYPALVYDDTDLFSKANIDEAIKNGYYETKSIRTGDIFKFGKELMLETLKYKPYDCLLTNTLPKLMIHGKKDSLVPYINTERLSNECSNTTFIAIDNGTHGFFDNEEHYNFVLNETIKYILFYR